jgi:hypothetical protein
MLSTATKIVSWMTRDFFNSAGDDDNLLSLQFTGGGGGWGGPGGDRGGPGGDRGGPGGDRGGPGGGGGL